MGILVRPWFSEKKQDNNYAKNQVRDSKKPGPPPPPSSQPSSPPSLPSPPSPPSPRPPSSTTMNNPLNPGFGGPSNTQPLPSPSSALSNSASPTLGLTQFPSSSTFTTLPTPTDTAPTETNALSTIAPIVTVSSERLPSPTSTAATSGPNGVGLHPPPKNHAPMYAAAAVVPVVVVAIIGIFLYVRMRKRRNQKAIAESQMEEMKAEQPLGASAYRAPLVSREPSYTRPPRHTPPPSPPHIILGPISAGTNGNYFTGIDTSDMVSLRSNGRTGLGDPFADGHSHIEEPPPPYQPSSFVPFSYNASLRSSSYASSHTHLVNGRGLPLQSPFDDPRNADDAMSEVTRTSTRNRNRMSAVSSVS